MFNVADIDQTPVVSNTANFSQTPMSTISKANGLSADGQTYGAMKTLGGATLLGLPNLADTISSSVGLTSKGDINRYVLNAVGSPGFNQFAANISGATEFTSAALGVVGAELLTRGAIGAAPELLAGLRTMPYGRRVLALDDQLMAARATMRAFDTELAATGLNSTREFAASLTVPVATWTPDALTIGDKLVTRGQAVNAVRKYGALSSVGHAALTESIMAVTLNQNDFLYSDSMAFNIAASVTGLGFAGAFGSAVEGYAIRKFAANDELSRLRAGALDPLGIEQANHKSFFDELNPKKDTYLGGLGGVQTDKATGLFLQAAAAVGPVVNDSSANLMRTFRLGQGFTELEKVTQKGLGLKGTGFIIGNGDSESLEGAAVKAFAYADPGNMLGIEQLGARPAGYSTSGLVQARTAAIQGSIDELTQKLADNAAGKLKKPLDGAEQLKIIDRLKKNRYAMALTPSVVIDGERLPMQYADQFDDWLEPTIKAKKDSGFNSIFEAFNEDNQTHGLAMDDGLKIFNSTGKTIDEMDQYDIWRLGRLGAKAKDSAVTKMEKSAEFRINLDKDSNWVQIDLANEVADEVGTRGSVANINWGAGRTREQAQLESLAQKMDYARKHADMFSDSSAIRALRTRLNMPRLSAAEMGFNGSETHPLDAVFRGVINAAPGVPIREQLESMGTKGVLQAMNEYKKLQGMSPDVIDSIKSTQGNLFSFNTNESGRPIPLLVAFSRPLRPFEYAVDNLVDRMAIAKAQVGVSLMEPRSGPFTNGVSKLIYENPSLVKAADVGSISDTSLAPNLIPGTHNFAPASMVGSAINAGPLMTAEFRARDEPATLAVIRLKEEVDRHTRGYAKAAFVRHGVDDLKNQIYSRTNSQSALLLDQYYTHGIVSGWDLEKKLVDLKGPDGKQLWGFALRDTQGNRARFQNQFGREMQKGEQLIGPKGQKVVLDDLSRSFVEAMKPIHEEQRMMDNALNRTLGTPEIAQTEWYVPPPDIRDKFVAYVVGPDGQPVPGGALISDTQSGLAKLKSEMEADPASLANREGNLIRGRTEISQFASLWDRRQMEMVDANDAIARGGRKNLGRLAGSQMEAGAGIKALQAVQQKYVTHGSDVLETILADPIQAAQARANMSKGELKSRQSDIRDKTLRSAHDYWLEAVRGTSPLNSPGSFVAPVYNSVEAGVNRILAEVSPAFGKVGQMIRSNGVYHAVNDWASKRIPWTNSAADRQTFDKLTSALGEYMPFKDVDKYLENALAAKSPELKNITAAMNKFTGTWVLRMLETGQPIMNLGGILTTMPAVVSHYRQLEGETLNDMLRRVGNTAVIGQTPDQKIFSALSMPKLAYEGFKARWSKDADYLAFVERTGKLGMRNQEVAEFDRQMAAVQSKSDLRAFIVGDDSRAGFSKKGIVGWTSLLSDKSEDFSRSWAMDIGYTLGKQIGIDVKSSAIDNFAHEIANKMIANYNPLNRSEVYQGAVGSIFGLFQSYMTNYYQRMFRYLETGDLRSAAIQSAMQTMMFGGKTAPGFQQLNNLAFHYWDGKDSPYDSMVRRFGPRAGDLLMSGTMSNLPRLLGAPAIDFSSRGDTSPRIPHGDIMAAPAIQAMSKIVGGVGEALQTLVSQHGINTSQRMSEIFANMLPNRPLSGMVETVLGNQDHVDGYGQLVSHSAGLAENVYRVMGMRSLRQSRDLEAFYANKQMNEIAASKNALLSATSRAAIRSGNQDELPKLFNAYVENGGDPRHFSKWYRDSYTAATSTRSQRMLQSVFRNPNKMAETTRLLDAEVTPAQADATPLQTDAYPTPSDPQHMEPGYVPDTLAGQYEANH